MIQTIEWDSYTYRSYVGQCEENIARLEAELDRAKHHLSFAQAQFQAVVPLGMADSSLPSNFGEIVLAAEFNAGMLPEGVEIGAKIRKIAADMMTGSQSAPVRR